MHSGLLPSLATGAHRRRTLANSLRVVSPPPQGVGVAQPYVRLQENCWALTVHPDGKWRVSYDL